MLTSSRCGIQTACNSFFHCANTHTRSRTTLLHIYSTYCRAFTLLIWTRNDDLLLRTLSLLFGRLHCCRSYHHNTLWIALHLIQKLIIRKTCSPQAPKARLFRTICYLAIALSLSLSLSDFLGHTCRLFLKGIYFYSPVIY
jgi:hypothetical protein